MDRRHRRVLAAAPVGLLDLSDPLARELVEEVARTPTTDPVPDDRFEIIVSPAALTTWPDLPRVLRALVRLLAPADPDGRPAGRLVMIEPIARPATRGLIVGSIGTVAAGGRPLSRSHLNRDVPGAARDAGLTISEIERFSMSTSVWILRRFVEATAEMIGGHR